MNNQIVSFHKNNATALGEKIVAALQQIASEHGISIRAGGGNFDGADFTMKLAIRCTGEEAEKLDFAKDCQLFNCKATDYGREATINHRDMILIGFELKRRAFPVRCREKSTGKIVLFRDDVLARHFHTGTAL